MRIFITILIFVSSLFGGAKEKFDVLAKRIKKEPVDLIFNLDIYWSVREKTEKKKGSMLLADNNRFDLVLSGNRWVCNGTTLWQYNVSEKQLVIQNAASMNKSMNPRKMFDKFIEREFVVVSSKSGEILRWSGKDNEYIQIDVKLSSDGKRIESVLLIDDEKNESRYQFSKMTFLKTIDSKRFNFTKPAGTEVFDER